MKRSHFDGTILQLVGYSILAVLLTVVTFGIGFPWALCMLQRWETRHTIIESKRLQFNGTGLQLLGKWIVLAMIPFAALFGCAIVVRIFVGTKFGTFLAGIMLLALAVCALLYNYFVVIELRKWTISHTEFEVHIAAYSPDAAGIHTGPGPRPVPYQAPEKDWVDNLEPIMPLIYVLWPCVVFAATWGILSLIFK